MARQRPRTRTCDRTSDRLNLKPHHYPRGPARHDPNGEDSGHRSGSWVGDAGKDGKKLYSSCTGSSSSGSRPGGRYSWCPPQNTPPEAPPVRPKLSINSQPVPARQLVSHSRKPAILQAFSPVCSSFFDILFSRTCAPHLFPAIACHSSIRMIFIEIHARYTLVPTARSDACCISLQT